MESNVNKYISIIVLSIYIGSFYIFYPIIGNTLMISSIIPVLFFLWSFNLKYGLLIQFLLILHRFIALKILGIDIHVLFSFGTIIGTLINIVFIFKINFLINTIRESKKAKEKLKNQNIELQIAKSNAEESNRLKSAILANISHEIRTPMNAILGFSSLLKEPNICPEDKYTYIDLIDTNGNKLINLIDDIIDISKIEVSQYSIFEKECRLNDILSELSIIFQSSEELKNKTQVKLYIHKKKSNVNDIIYTDRKLLYKILFNLIENAIKFTEAGTVDVEYIIKNDNIQVIIKDTGIGISKEKIPVIFDSFRQGEQGSTRNYGGLGLGLAISKAYVNLLGGKIWVLSEIGKGSEFCFTIPYKETIRT